MIRDLNALGLVDILPANLLMDKQIKAAAQALDKELQAVSQAIAEVIHLPRLDMLPESVVDLLAWQWHVDFYDKELPLDIRRELIKKSIDYHRHKGTKYAVEGVVKTCFPDAIVLENWEYNGKPYCFKVTTINSAIPETEEIARIIQAINSVKNVRSHLDEISFIRYLKATMYMGSYLTAHKSIDIGARRVADTTVNGKIYCGFGTYLNTKDSINIKHAENADLEATLYCGFAINSHTKQNTAEKMAGNEHIVSDAQKNNGIMQHKCIVIMPATNQQRGRLYG